MFSAAAVLLFCITGMADFFWVCSRGKSEEFKISQELVDCFSNKAGNLVLTSTPERFSDCHAFLYTPRKKSVRNVQKSRPIVVKKCVSPFVDSS